MTKQNWATTQVPKLDVVLTFLTLCYCLRKKFVNQIWADSSLAHCRNVKWCDYWTHNIIDSPTRPPQSRTRHTIIRTTLLAVVLRLLADKSSYNSLVKQYTPENNRHIDASLCIRHDDKWPGQTTHNWTERKHNESNFQLLAHTRMIAFELNQLWLKMWWQESKR